MRMEAIREALLTASTNNDQLPPDLNELAWEEMERIEKILDQVEKLITIQELLDQVRNARRR